MQLSSIMYFLTKKCLFLIVLVKKGIYHVTKGMKRLFFQLLVSFDFLKSILDDAIIDKNDIQIWAKTWFLDIF